MAIDRGAARRRVTNITAWAAAGAAALAAGAAFGAARSHSNVASAPQASAPAGSTNDALPQTAVPQDQSGGFQPPAASTGPPAGMSGGS